MDDVVEAQSTEQEPLVSVVVPCRNEERFVGAAIESVLLQTYHAIETIVVDDGSTDGSWEIISSYVSGVRALRQAHGVERSEPRRPRCCRFLLDVFGC